MLISVYVDINTLEHLKKHLLTQRFIVFNILLIFNKVEMSYMKKEASLTSRVNLMIPLDITIQIEKESERRGINRTQFIKEAIHEKLKKSEKKDVIEEINIIKNEMREIKQLVLATLEKIQHSNFQNM